MEGRCRLDPLVLARGRGLADAVAYPGDPAQVAGLGAGLERARLAQPAGDGHHGPVHAGDPKVARVGSRGERARVSWLLGAAQSATGATMTVETWLCLGGAAWAFLAAATVWVIRGGAR
jgi:hypothetical protein